MEITLRMKDNVYKESEDGKSRKLVKRNVITSIHLDTNDIITVSDVINDTGKILKNYCRLQVREMGPLIVYHTREAVLNMKNKKTKINAIGFRQRKDRRNRTKN